MLKYGRRGDVDWPELRGVTMKNLTETQSRRDMRDQESGSRTKTEDHETNPSIQLGTGMAEAGSGEEEARVRILLRNQKGREG